MKSLRQDYLWVTTSLRQDYLWVMTTLRQDYPWVTTSLRQDYLWVTTGQMIFCLAPVVPKHVQSIESVERQYF